MRLTTLTAASAVASVAFLLTSPLFAQIGTQLAVPSVAPSISAPAISAPSAVTNSLSVAAGQALGAPVSMGTAPTQFSGQSVLTSPMAYSGPVSYGGGSVASQSAAYGPLNVGPYPQGPACCNLSPTQPGYCRKCVTSCCGNIGPLGVPPLLTPARFDTPPFGAAVGRPLLGRWTGF